MTKRIVLCADDYGQAEAVSAGILELLQNNRLTAVSCMVNQSDWPQAAAKISAFTGQADIGLHLNFTHGSPLSSACREQLGDIFPSLNSILWLTMTRSRQITPVALIAEIEAQIEAFTVAVGRPPQFIDGHQHVHHLPLIRGALMEVYQRKFPARDVYLRVVNQELKLKDYIGKGFKRAVIALTGGASFAALLDERNIPHNASFNGIYDFDAENYRQYFRGFLAASGDRGLIMCHPGHASQDITDPIRAARAGEFAYLNSLDFIADCHEFGVTLSRFAVG